MIIHPNFDPVAIHLGPLAVRWYGLMYLVGFIAAIVVGRVRLKLPHVAAQGWTAKDIDDMMFYGVLGTVLGGRLGYVLFYKADFYLSHPLDIFKVWEGGMSFHGGFLGVTLAMILFAWQRKRHWLQVTDFVAPMVPTGLAAGRLGNFINGELWGRVTDPSAPWAMLFPGAMRDDAAWLPKHRRSSRSGISPTCSCSTRCCRAILRSSMKSRSKASCCSSCCSSSRASRGRWARCRRCS